MQFAQATKFKENPRSTFTIEGYNQEDTNLEDENDLTCEPLGSFEAINDEEFQPTPQTHAHGDEGLSTPTQSPVTSVGSTSPASSTTGGGAPKRYRLLTDIYEECDELLFMQDTDEPMSYRTAAKDRERVKAMWVELDAIEKCQTWSIVDLPTGRKPIGLKWIYKLKLDPSGNILKHKARLVAKGYVQKPRVDFDELFAPIARIETIRILLALSSSHGWKVHHLDVNSAFLNGRLEEEVHSTGFDKLLDHELEIGQVPKRTELHEMWAGICCEHKKTTWRVLLKAGMADCNPSQSPMEHKLELTKDEGEVSAKPTLFRSIIRGLRYLTYTRPDIAYVVGIVSRFMEKPTVNHMQAVKTMLRYIKGTVDYGLVYTKYSKGDVITGYSDSNHARNVEDRRSTGGMVFYLKENLVTWGLKKQQCVALSSCEVEFMAATTATCQGIWGSVIDGHADFEIGDHKSSSEQRDCSSDDTAEVLVSDGPSRRGKMCV
uniref:Reverse transcriptase Ty1/copia-type domain-containing protein n=1 Tax=Tanacetum cinerariifolium TaxID=118510 RepID=A0A699H5V9_TANCI|nr:hypothetical protein [Tanacetum cinerariifolium]